MLKQFSTDAMERHGVFFFWNLPAQNQDPETAWHCACGVVQAKVFRVVTLGEKERVDVCQPVCKT